MTPRELVITALEGQTPAKTPLTIYDWNMGAVTIDELEAKMRQPSWRRLLDRGLSVRCHCPIVTAVEHGVEYQVAESQSGGAVYRTEIKTTPLGVIRKVTRDGWHHEDWLKSPADYKVQQWIIENTELIADYEAYERAEQVVADQGVVVVTGAGNWQHRTPAMSINIDWAGTEQFCMDLAMELPELFELYAAGRKLFFEQQHLIAAGPGRYVAWFENLTISMLGPNRYRELLATVYDEAMPIHAAAGKRVMVHYDGAMGCVADQIAAAPFSIIDSLTEPPEGDMAYDECRRIWPDKIFWANINVDLYYRSAMELRLAVVAKRERAGKQAFAFEVSEDLPSNWETSIPVVLDVLEELG